MFVFSVVVYQLATWMVRASSLYSEGYDKGVHDHDATLILKELVTLYNNSGLLRYNSYARAHAILFWVFFPDEEKKEELRNKLQSFGLLVRTFESADINWDYISKNDKLQSRLSISPRYFLYRLLISSFSPLLYTVSGILSGRL